MPGMKPLCASWRRHRRQSLTLLYTARGRLQRRHRLCCRVMYLGVRWEATILDVFAMNQLSSGRDGVCRQALVLLRAPVARERHSERVQQRERLASRLRRRGDGHVEATDLVDRVIVDLRKDDLLA